ncbi:MAG: SpoIIE family protein phosphatase [Peptococcaceae bacterium]|nr:SpoIIE family protein phosphatase [Peptococcaceae bacterium]
MKLTADIGVAKGNKYREELCGDAVKIIRTAGQTTVILSDGLGSGVKANIVATLTTQIATGLLQRQVPIEHVISTIVDTLPICRVRGLAYATFSILQIHADGRAMLYEYDAPPAFLFRNDRVVFLERTTRTICGRIIHESNFFVEEDDVLLMVTDGIINAGVGESFDLGLGEGGLMHFLTSPCTNWHNAEQLADFIVKLAYTCYRNKLGDDCTAVTLRVRAPKMVTVLSGPPLSPENDVAMVQALMEGNSSKKIVCGGTSAKIVARVIRAEIETTLEYIDPRVPPVAIIKGIDLVTEGVLTLNRCYEILREVQSVCEFPRTTDGATLLAKEIWNAEEVRFLVGKSFNQAHANIEELMQLAPRQYIITRLVSLLNSRGVRTEIIYY